MINVNKKDRHKFCARSEVLNPCRRFTGQWQDHGAAHLGHIDTSALYLPSSVPAVTLLVLLT